MKSLKGKLLSIALMAAVALLCTGFGGCASLQTQQQKIAVACESSASAADAIAIATTAGRVSKAQAQQALAVYRVTVPFCQPQPVESLSSVDYAALLSASAQLTLLAENTR